MTTTEPKRRTVTLTDRPPVTILEVDWPVVAEANKSSDNHEHRVSLKVRRHEDGRSIIYGVVTQPWANYSDHRAGELLGSDEDPIPAMRRVIGTLDELGGVPGAPAWDWEVLIADWIADLPAESI